MTPIFLYLRTASFRREDLKKIRAAGYIPIQVDSFDDVRILDSFTADSGTVTESAIEAMHKAGYSSTWEHFGKGVAARVTKKSKLPEKTGAD